LEALNAMTNPQVDSMIENGKSLKEVIPVFPTKIAAYEYYARYMTQRFASPDKCCVVCSRSCEDPPVKFSWRANIHTTKTVLLSFLFTALALFAAHLYSRWVVIEFATYHRLCPDCRRRHRLRSILIGIARKVLFTLLMLLLFLTVPLVVFLIAMPFIAPEITWPVLAIAVLGIGLLALNISGFEICRRSQIPHSLRQVGRIPFFLYDQAGRI
jgi:hypothetical protein